MTLRFHHILILGFLLISLSTAVSAESVNDYTRLLANISQQLDHAARLEQASPDLALPVINKLWNDCPASVRVPAGNGKYTNADLGWVRDELYELQRTNRTERVDRINKLRQRITTVSSITDSSPGMGSESVNKAKSTLKNVLKGSEYKPSLIDIISRKIDDIIRYLLSSLNISEGAASVMGWVIITVAVIAFIALIVYLVMYIVKLYATGPDRERSFHRAKLKTSRRQTPESVLEAAERDAAAGRYRDAFRGIYLASILLLDRAKLLKYTEGVTNWEYLRTLNRAEIKEPAQVFGDMTVSFDEYVYGNHAVTSGDYNRTLSQYRKLEGLF